MQVSASDPLSVFDAVMGSCLSFKCMRFILILYIAISESPHAPAGAHNYFRKPSLPLALHFIWSLGLVIVGIISNYRGNADDGISRIVFAFVVWTAGADMLYLVRRIYGRNRSHISAAPLAIYAIASVISIIRFVASQCSTKTLPYLSLEDTFFYVAEVLCVVLILLEIQISWTLTPYLNLIILKIKRASVTSANTSGSVSSLTNTNTRTQMKVDFYHTAAFSALLYVLIRSLWMATSIMKDEYVFLFAIVGQFTSMIHLFIEKPTTENEVGLSPDEVKSPLKGDNPIISF